MSRILDLVNRVAPFEFEYDGEKLSGTFFKYRTNSPIYQGRINAELRAIKDKATAAEGKPESEVEAALKEYEAGLRRVAARALADTIKTWNAVEVFPRTLTAEEYEFASERIRRFYKPKDESRLEDGYVIVNDADADTERPVPITVEVFEEMPTLFANALGDHFKKLREDAVNPTPPGSSQNG